MGEYSLDGLKGRLVALTGRYGPSVGPDRLLAFRNFIAYIYIYLLISFHII